MALGQVLKVDFTFKKLKGREETTLDKQWYEEFAGRLLYPHSKDVWVDEIPIPAPNSSTSSVRVFNDLVLTRDITVNYNRSWLCCEVQDDLSTRLRNFIPPRYDQSYTVRLFENNGSEIPTAHPSNWVFDYENGILFFENDPTNYGVEIPIHIKVYQYIGRTLDEVIENQVNPDISKVVTEAQAGETIEAFKVVFFKGDGKAYLASKQDTSILESVIGMSADNGDLSDEIDVILNGIVYNPDWNLIPNKAYFLGIDGEITDIPAGNGEILLKVGTAFSSKKLVFEPKIAIRR